MHSGPCTFSAYRKCAGSTANLNVNPPYGAAVLHGFARRSPNTSCGLDLSPRSSCLMKQTKPELQLFHLLLALPLYPGESLLMSRFALLLNIVVMI